MREILFRGKRLVDMEMETRKDRLTRRDPDGGIRVDDLPAALEKLAELEDAEEQGRLVRLPCKVGDMLWSFMDSPQRTVYSVTISEIRMSDKGDGFFTEMSALVTGFGWGTMEHIRPNDVGKTLFYTRAEAEAVLKARNAAQ